MIICAYFLVELNKYLDVFPGENISDKIHVVELNLKNLNIVPNSWIKQAYVEVFYCESITFKADVKMFERMEIAESIYDVVV